MTGEQDRPEPGVGDGAPEVGTVGEEAAKLLGAVSEAMGWPDRPRAARPGAEGPGGQHGHGDMPGWGEALAGLTEQAAGAWHEVGSHVATGAEECRYCPVCRAVHAVRQTSPEVRTHLATAARSLLDAAGALLADVAPPETTRDGVERIDLDDPENPTDPEENW